MRFPACFKFLFLLFGLSLASQSASAQKFELHGGGGLDIAAGNGGFSAGLDLRATFLFMQGKLGIQPDFSLLIDDVNLFEVNGNVIYRIPVGSRLHPYPLAGLSLAFAGGGSSVGLNIGGGMDIDVTNRLIVFPEMRGRIGDGNWFGATLGLKYRFIN